MTPPSSSPASLAGSIHTCHYTELQYFILKNGGGVGGGIERWREDCEIKSQADFYLGGAPGPCSHGNQQTGMKAAMWQRRLILVLICSYQLCRSTQARREAEGPPAAFRANTLCNRKSSRPDCLSLFLKRPRFCFKMIRSLAFFLSQSDGLNISTKSNPVCGQSACPEDQSEGISPDCAHFPPVFDLQ